MTLNIFGDARQGWNDIKSIVAPVTKTIRIGLSTQGIVSLSKEEENEIIEQLMIEEMLKGGYAEEQSVPTSTKAPLSSFNQESNLLQEPLTETDTLYHINRLKNNSLQYILGYGEDGNLIVQDLAREPHLIIGGTTGSGKSVTLFNILISLTYSNTPKTLKISLIDPKILSFGDDRLLHSPFLNEEPSIGDTPRALKILKSAYTEMMQRYQLMKQNRVKDYRKINLPSHVIFIDEIYELLEDKNKKEILRTITQIASLGRQAGVHLVMATQSIRAEVLGGNLKANVSKIGHRVSNSTESKVLECPNAHRLNGQGDGYKMLNGENEVTKFQATFLDIDKDSTYQYLGVKTPKTLGQNIGQDTQDTQDTQYRGQDTETMEFLEGVKTPKTLGQYTQYIPNLGLKEGAINLKQKIINSADANGKIASKKDLINVNNREQLNRFGEAVSELIKDGVVELRKGRGYYVVTDGGV